MPSLWRRDFRSWPRWLRRWHLANGALTLVVLTRLVLRDFGFDVWTHLWTAYICSYAAFIAWRADRGSGRASETDESSWLF